MAGLSDIVTVSISTANASVKQADFGIPMILGSHSRFTERIRFYNVPADMLSDGFEVGDAEYLAAQALCSQNPAVPRFAIGRRVNKPTAVYRIAIVAALAGQTYSVKINGQTVSFTADESPTLAEISAGLTSAIGLAVTGCTAAEVAGVGVDLTATTAETFLRVESLDVSRLTTLATHADAGGSAGVAADLAAVALENGDWYAFCLTSCGTGEVLAAAAWAEANQRLFVQASNDSAIIGSGSGDLASQLKTANYYRTALVYHPDNGSFVDAGWMGECLPRRAGSETWKFSTIAGVATVNLTPTQIVNLKAKNCNYYAGYSGLSMMADGKLAAGEWIDTVRGRDWLAMRMQVRAVVDMKNARDAVGKVSYTDDGTAILEGAVRATLAEAVSRGFLTKDPAPAVAVQKVADVAAVDRSSRDYKGITWSANLAGAIHAVTIYGSISA